jgi:hypothetical protein
LSHAHAIVFRNECPPGLGALMSSLECSGGASMTWRLPVA